MKTLGVIPARGGSKGLPRKNVRPLLGRPLIDWTIATATASGAIDRCVVSTDDPEIAAAAREGGAEVPFLRPAALARDDTPAIDVVLHALDVLGKSYDHVVLLQPTSPLRSTADIRNCLELARAPGASGCVSVTRTTESPFWMYLLTDEAHLRPVVSAPPIARRQDLPPAFIVNGAVYVARPESLRETRAFVGPATTGYEMPSERSIDIDTLEDFLAAEEILRRNGFGVDAAR